MQLNLSQTENNLLLKDVIKELESYKAEDVQGFDVQGKVIYTDFIIVATATSITHARALGKKISVYLKEKGYTQFNRVKKEESNQWVVLDFDDIIIHLMQRETRAHYRLEEIFEKCNNITK